MIYDEQKQFNYLIEIFNRHDLTSNSMDEIPFDKDSHLAFLMDIDNTKKVIFEFVFVPLSIEDYLIAIKHMLVCLDDDKDIEIFVVCLKGIGDYSPNEFPDFSELPVVIDFSSFDGDEILSHLKFKSLISPTELFSLVFIPFYNTKNTLFEQMNSVLDIMLKSANSDKDKEYIFYSISLASEYFLSKEENELIKDKLNYFNYFKSK